MNATELADYLVRKGLPFRTAHDITGKVVLRGIELQKELHELPLKEMQSICADIGEDVFDALSLESTIASKSQTGGTSREQVARALADAWSYLKE